eukprot:206629_1
MYIHIYPADIEMNSNYSVSNRCCNALSLLQCVASHPQTRRLFLKAYILLILYPLLNTELNNRSFEYLRLTSAGVMRASVKSPHATNKHSINNNNKYLIENNMQQRIENNKIELTEIKTTETALINYNVETNLISKSDNYTLKDKHHHHQYNQMNSMNHKNAISRNIYGCANTNLYANYINGIVTVNCDANYACYTMKSFCPTTSNMPNICNIDCTSFHSCDNTQFRIPQNQYNGLNLFYNCQDACDIGAGLTQLPYDNGTSYFKCVTYSCYAIYEGNIPCLSNVPCHV